MEIPTTSKSFSLYRELLQPLMGNLPKNGNVPIEAKGILALG